MSDAFAAPVIVFGFNRPDYLERVCRSLREQRRVQVDPARVWLVQDGPVSRRTGVRYAEDAEIAASVAAFRAVFPEGQVLDPEGRNFGIAENIQRGEALAFETLDAEWALFLEDDLELGPDYLDVTQRIAKLVEPFDNVAYFAAYGDHRRAEKPSRIGWRELDHHWAFVLRRQAWRRMQDWLKPYFAILARTDYQVRVHLHVYEWLLGREHAIDKSSQDALKAIACAELGLARVMTDAVFGRYIGERGASFNAQRYRDLGYDRTELVTLDGLDFAPLDEPFIASVVAESRRRLSEFRRSEFERFLDGYRQRNFDPLRMMTREEVDGLYRLLLDRIPESEAIYENNVGKRPLRDLRRAILNSREFRGRLVR